MSIKELCYELYKVDWKNLHVTYELERKSILSYYDSLTDNHSYSYEEYIEECGYSGEVYVCFEEF